MVAVVVGARLPDDTAAARSGAPDLLVYAQGGYVAVDVKHHRTINTGDAVLLTSTLAVPTPSAATLLADSELRAGKDDALQLAHYRRMLQAHGWAAPSSLGGIIGKERLVIWYDLDEAMWTTPAKSDGKKRKRRTTMEVYDFEFEFRRDKAADAVAGRPLLPPVRIADCASCGWRDRCNVDLEAGTGDPPANRLRRRTLSTDQVLDWNAAGSSEHHESRRAKVDAGTFGDPIAQLSELKGSAHRFRFLGHPIDLLAIAYLARGFENPLLLHFEQSMLQVPSGFGSRVTSSRPQIRALPSICCPFDTRTPDDDGRVGQSVHLVVVPPIREAE